MTLPLIDPVGAATTSRYRDLAVLTHVDAAGREQRYLERRFLPDPATLTITGFHAVSQGDRLDAIAAVTIGDPQLWWRLADADRAPRPRDLLDPPGRRLAIPLALALPGGGGV